MQYIKHYWVDNISNEYCCHTNDPKEKRHPNKEFAGLDVKVWLQDVDGIDVCLSEVPDTTSVSTVTDEDGKNCVKVLTLEEFNSVATPYFEAQTLSSEAQQARQNGDEATAEAKETAAAAKLAEATTAIRAL